MNVKYRSNCATAIQRVLQRLGHVSRSNNISSRSRLGLQLQRLVQIPGPSILWNKSSDFWEAGENVEVEIATADHYPLWKTNCTIKSLGHCEIRRVQYSLRICVTVWPTQVDWCRSMCVIINRENWQLALVAGSISVHASYAAFARH